MRKSVGIGTINIYRDRIIKELGWQNNVKKTFEFISSVTFELKSIELIKKIPILEDIQQLYKIFVDDIVTIEKDSSTNILFPIISCLLFIYVFLSP